LATFAQAISSTNPTAAVHDREHGGVRADAERDRQDRRQRKPGIPVKQAKGEPHVLREPIEPASGPHVARDVLHQGQATKLAEHGLFRIIAAKLTPFSGVAHAVSPAFAHGISFTLRRANARCGSVIARVESAPRE
jgi:hypothetical protein